MVQTVYLVIAESAIETIPKEIIDHSSVLNDSKRRGIQPDRLLLDRSLHHGAMLKLRDQEKRGRPDILYHIMLDVTNTPVFKTGILRLVFHTYNDFAIWVRTGLRPPRSYYRYENLMIQLFSNGKVGDQLLVLEKLDIEGLIKRIQPDKVIGFSRLAAMRSLEQIAQDSIKYNVPTFIVGGFPKGHFSKKTLSVIDQMYSISPFPLDASLVVNRFVYELECVKKINRLIEYIQTNNISSNNNQNG